MSTSDTSPSASPPKKRSKLSRANTIQSETYAETDPRWVDSLSTPAVIDIDAAPEDGYETERTDVSEERDFDGYSSEEDLESEYEDDPEGGQSPGSVLPRSPPSPHTPPRCTIEADTSEQSYRHRTPLPDADSGDQVMPHIMNDSEEVVLQIKARNSDTGEPIQWVVVLKLIPENEGRRNRVFKDTPETKTKSSTSASQKNKAKDADPNEGRCLITGSLRLSSGYIQICHVIPKALWKNIAFHRQLSRAWGYSVHLDTHYNLINLKPDWHYMFDQGFWLLVPTLEIIEDMIKKAQAQLSRGSGAPVSLRKVYSETRRKFDYYFVTILGSDRNMGPFFRRRQESGTSTPYYFPYTTMPILRCHAQPQFVAYHAINMYNQIQIKQGQETVRAYLQLAYEHHEPNASRTVDEHYSDKCFDRMNQLLKIWWSPNMPPLRPLMHGDSFESRGT
ncbi:hypothetical protein CONPUDRAFT_167137 [Coniophora puteana RWD-64-598 SS2]|uniref:HNH nuclease domain-containing protein n=1 Tax=Coniophora puteana (strain RWD-64-598) TaxID=741705 RepID=A0A5M3MJJ4_CONPW|nr:uncharacterized protein CONPUDRAFT_167137 [Coniophora puteana RWD-64-598 SS2]EIW79382.1 hypothetical protein CONPUDRAFT_167137 [Coniophora puteana RWD-64-598 SS2]